MSSPRRSTDATAQVRVEPIGEPPGAQHPPAVCRVRDDRKRQQRAEAARFAAVGYAAVMFEAVGGLDHRS